MKRIPLTQGKVALVDDTDYEWLNQWKWYAWTQPTKKQWYAVRQITDRPNHQSIVWMHREIMEPPDDMQVDHINHNGLDNRKTNLRICTGSQNQHNQRISKRGKSQFKGVYLDNDSYKWRVSLRNRNKTTHLGYFDSEIEAAKAYNKRAKSLFGEFACLNEVA